MAQGLRSRPVTAGDRALPRRLATFVLLLATACGGDANGGDASEQRPRPVDVRGIADDALVDAVLDECHGPLRGRMQRLAALVTLPDGSKLRVFTELPLCVRIQGDSERLLLLGDTVHRIDGGATTEADRARAMALAALVDAAAFGPLHRATSCRARDDGGYDVTTDDGASWRLELHPDTLLPAALARGDVRVVFDDYLRTSTTWVVKRASIAKLGSCRITFDDGGIEWRPDFFTPPAEAAPRVGQRIGAPGVVRETRSPTPLLVEAKATELVLLDDPGTWTERVAAYAPVHEQLVTQEQLIAGFPYYWEEHGKRMLGAPFRQRPGKPAFEAPAGWRTRSVAAGRWLVVFPAEGDVEARVRAGTAMLQKALAESGLRQRGPITAQPYVHLEDGAPAPESLATTVVRLSVAVE